MTEQRRISRRQAVALSGSTLLVAAAGCTSSSDDADSGDSDDWQQPLEPSDWEDVEEIHLEGYTNGWAGVEPDLIGGVRNPTLLLFAGNDYEITWENGDGGMHNIAVRNETKQVVNSAKTTTMRDRGKTQTLEFEATEGMHEYVCEPHPRAMMGHIRVDN